MAASEPPIPRSNLYLGGQGALKLRMGDIIGTNTNLDQFTDLKIWHCTLELAGYQVPIADAFRRMKNLTTLRLENVELHSSTFLEIESKKLKRLHICHCDTRLQVASLFKNDLCYKDSLVELRLDENRWSEIPNGIFQFQNLLNLSLSYNCLTELPDKFTDLPKLQVLSLSSNRLTHLPPSIFALQNLSKLYLCGNLISELPDMFTNLPMLKILLLDENQLRYVPSSVFALQNLYKLSLNNNYITELPDMFTNLPKLKFLSLDRNQLKDVPSSIFALENLAMLSLSGNRITELPDKFTNLPNLKNLSLDNNQLRYLPPSICSLDLSQLDIESNEFNFEIPPSVGSEMIEHPLQELSYRAILKHELIFKEGLLPKKVLKALTNFHQCICGCKFVKGQDLLFFCNLKVISRVISYNRDAHYVKFPIRGKMCTSFKSCFLDRFTK